MQEKLDELTRLNDEMQRQMDRFAGLLKTTYANPNPLNMKILRQESRELNRQADELNQKLDDLKEKNPVKRTLLLAVLTIVLLVFVSSFAVAQDNPLATTTPLLVEGTATLVSSEPLPTEAPAPVVTDVPSATTEPPIIIVNPAPTLPAADPPDRTIYVIGLALFLIYQVIRDLIAGKRENALLTGLNKAHNNQQLMDEAHQRYTQSSLSTQQVVQLLHAFTGLVGSLNIPGIDPLADEAHEILEDVVTPPTAPGDLAQIKTNLQKYQREQGIEPPLGKPHIEDWRSSAGEGLAPVDDAPG